MSGLSLCVAINILFFQIADTKTVDEEPVQSVPPFQNVKMDPEDKWYLKSQQLKVPFQ